MKDEIKSIHDEVLHMMLEDEFKICLITQHQNVFEYEDRNRKYDSYVRLHTSEIDGKNVHFYIYPLMYLNMKPGKTPMDFVDSRAAAISALFVRWEKAGNNKHLAKNPYSSKGFLKYLEDIGFTEADYLIVGLLGE